MFACSNEVFMCCSVQRGLTSSSILEAYFRKTSCLLLVLFLAGKTFWGLFLLAAVVFFLTLLDDGVKKPSYGGVSLCVNTQKNVSWRELHLHTCTHSVTQLEPWGPVPEVSSQTNTSPETLLSVLTNWMCVYGQEGIRSVVLIVSECAVAVPLSS